MAKTIWKFPLAVTDRYRVAKPKTRVWIVRNTTARIRLGSVRWFGAWRQYAFDPDGDLSFEKSCLRTIADFCERQTKTHYAKLKAARERE